MKKPGSVRVFLALAITSTILVGCWAWVLRPVWAQTLVYVGLWAVGNAQGCPLSACLDPLEPRIWAEESRLRTESRLLETSSEGLQHWATPAGNFWKPIGNPMLYLLAEQELSLYDSGPLKIRPGDTVIDCGANIGTFTRKALSRGAGLVIAVEVDPMNILCLNRTFRSEIEKGKVIVIEEGVWDSEGTFTLYQYSNSALSSLVMKDRAGSTVAPRQINVPLTTIDKIVNELELETVDYIKMDIEGAERRALKGAANTLRKYRPRLSIAAENLSDDVVAIPDVVNEAAPGYQQQNGPCRRILQFHIRPEVIYFF